MSHKMKMGRINSLREKHRELDVLISTMYEAGWPGEYLTKLKAQKLRLKEQLDDAIQKMDKV
mgnify:CR=1 FL=1|jgi:uncharacterized protein YdcH (DUF465 family)